MMMTDDGQPLNYIIHDGEADICLSPDAEKLADTQVMPMRLYFADFDPIARARALERRKRMTPHHSSNTVIQLIPSDLHNNVPHIGSASDMRGGL